MHEVPYVPYAPSTKEDSMTNENETTQEERLAQLVAATGGKVIEDGKDVTVDYTVETDAERFARVHREAVS